MDNMRQYQIKKNVGLFLLHSVWVLNRKNPTQDDLADEFLSNNMNDDMQEENQRKMKKRVSPGKYLYSGHNFQKP